MALYQDLIMDQIKNIGKPRESKSTTTQTTEPPKEGIEGLMMMLMLMQMFKDPNAMGGGLGQALSQGRTADVFAPTPTGAQMAPLLGGPQGGFQGGPDMLTQILMALLGGGGQMPGVPIGGMGTGVPGSPF